MNHQARCQLKKFSMVSQRGGGLTALWPTSIKFQVFLCANVIQLMDLLYDLLIQRQDISRLNMCRLIFLEKEQLVSCHQESFKNRLLSGVERGSTVRRIRHRGSRSWKSFMEVAVLKCDAILPY